MYVAYLIRRCCTSQRAAGSFPSIWRQESQNALAFGSWYKKCRHWLGYRSSHPCKRWFMEGNHFFLLIFSFIFSHSFKFAINFTLISIKRTPVFTSLQRSFDVTYVSLLPHHYSCKIQVMTNQEAVDIARKTKDPHRAAKQLAAEALKKDSKDDISVIVVRFKGWKTKRKYYYSKLLRFVFRGFCLLKMQRYMPTPVWKSHRKSSICLEFASKVGYIYFVCTLFSRHVKLYLLLIVCPVFILLLFLWCVDTYTMICLL